MREKEVDILHNLWVKIDGAIDKFEGPAFNAGASRASSREALELAATALLMAGKHEDLERLAQTLAGQMTPSVLDLVAWSRIVQGNALSERAKTKAGEEADALLRAAGEKYAQALAIDPDNYDALYNWGNALSERAKTKAGEEADALLRAAGEKYAQALAIDYTLDALYNWGNALSERAKTKAGEEADALLRAAKEKYEEAEALAYDISLATWPC